MLDTWESLGEVASTANAMASSKASKISTSGRPRCADGHSNGLTTWGPL